MEIISFTLRKGVKASCQTILMLSFVYYRTGAVFFTSDRFSDAESGKHHAEN
jgi:hypothetical protein